MSELDTLTEVERVILRHAVRDLGRGIYASPMIGRSVSNVGRYLTEGGGLLPQHPWKFVWTCIRQLVEREPALLEGPAPTTAQVAEARTARERQADALLDDALGAFRLGAWDEALALIDRAELVAPTYRPAFRTYDDLRGYVRTNRAAADVKETTVVATA